MAFGGSAGLGLVSQQRETATNAGCMSLGTHRHPLQAPGSPGFAERVRLRSLKPS